MKKILMTAIAALTMGIFAESTDVYSLRLNAKVPALNNGVRTYTSQKLTGNLYLTWDDEGVNVTEAWAEVRNSKTKVNHVIKFNLDNCLYNLMGKANKKIERPVATVAFSGKDDAVECEESHEFISNIALAGMGSLTYTKGVTSCGVCGDTSSTAGCAKLNKVSGNFVGVMDCLCPEDISWSHTLVAKQCGLLEDEEGNYVPTHYASFWGTWSASFNKKESAIFTK